MNVEKVIPLTVKGEKLLICHWPEASQGNYDTFEITDTAGDQITKFTIKKEKHITNTHQKNNIEKHAIEAMEKPF